MGEHKVTQSDYGTGQKKLSIYVLGMISCALLTIISFAAVMSGKLVKWETFTIIYSAACLQFLLQLICFLRLNTQTEQGRTNVMSFLFTGVILVSIILGSLWIMRNTGYNMMH